MLQPLALSFIHLDGLLVGLALGVVLLLVKLVAQSVLGSRGTVQGNVSYRIPVSVR